MLADVKMVELNVTVMMLVFLGLVGQWMVHGNNSYAFVIVGGRDHQVKSDLFTTFFHN